MADTGEITDINEHQSTYGGFTAMMKWGTVAAVIVAAFVVFMIA
ncbi:aa3-type cytochrome c oxidase subunit IV [Sphingomonas sp. IC-56]|nr:aa3-type cytochrome c oxidase subunit IV [Sphingomonas sp. IC-56]MCD2323381.1 aa3-type cytochrome c oxidase subunit IV [Sphingomonas sp. IC-56]